MDNSDTKVVAGYDIYRNDTPKSIRQSVEEEEGDKE